MLSLNRCLDNAPIYSDKIHKSWRVTRTPPLLSAFYNSLFFSALSKLPSRCETTNQENWTMTSILFCLISTLGGSFPCSPLTRALFRIEIFAAPALILSAFSVHESEWEDISALAPFSLSLTSKGTWGGGAPLKSSASATSPIHFRHRLFAGVCTSVKKIIRMKSAPTSTTSLTIFFPLNGLRCIS